MKQRVVVLGATGFIGRRLVAALAASDWAHPVAASRRASTAFDNNIESVTVDANDADAVSKLITGAGAVVNCIAGDAGTIINSAKALLAVATKMNPSPRVVHLSSLAAYGSATGVVTESTPLRGDLDEYSAAKAQVEQLAKSCATVVTLRPGIVYGPNSPWWSDRIARLLIARRLGNLGDVGQGFCNLVHVDDVVKAVLLALRQPGIEGEAFNLSTPSPPTWNQYFASYGQALGVKPVPVISNQQLVLQLRVFAFPMKLIERIAIKLHRHPTPPLRPWLIKLCQQQIALDVSKAEAQLGMQWLPLSEGLQQTAAWFLAGGRTP